MMPMTRQQATACRLPAWGEQRGFTANETLLLERSVRDPVTECWEWLGSVKDNGYGRITVSGRSFHVHRFALEVFRGIVVPPELDVCHSCDFRRCINPAHLFVGSRLDNMRDAKQKGRLSVGPTHGALVSAGRRRHRGFS